jgi:hypothetical protein
MYSRTIRNRTPFPMDEASIPNKAAELDQHRQLVQSLTNELRGAVDSLLPRLQARQREPLARPLAETLTRVVADFSLETSRAVNGELARQLEVGSHGLGQLVQQMDWALDAGYLAKEEHERVVRQVKALLLGAQNLRWFLTGHSPAARHGRSRRTSGLIPAQG